MLTGVRILGRYSVTGGFCASVCRKRREKIDGVIARGGECGPVALCDWIAWRQWQVLEIQKFAVALDAEIEMRAGG